MTTSGSVVTRALEADANRDLHWPSGTTSLASTATSARVSLTLLRYCLDCTVYMSS
uniref:Uncharacterized protein n=1 Tax=Anguilla anguilla TaxID=7936 RepID=A0A0E9PHC7_ANGAN